MSGAAETRVAVVGLGFMGRTHVRAYRAAARAGYPNRLTAVCDRDAGRMAGKPGAAGNLEAEGDGRPLFDEPLFDPERVRGFAAPEELFAQADVDLVSICSPTDTHVDLAVAALRAGKHVVVEKPVALASAGVEHLAAVAAEAGRLCMPAMCMRFWPGWRWLKESIESSAFGPVRSAVFRRLAARPKWSPGFYGDLSRTGGALFDLHVHDSDFALWCFGAPQAVRTFGSLNHLTTAYTYPDGPAHVVAEGGWDHTDGFEFRMGYTVVFEEATADFDFHRDPRLVLSRDGSSEPVDLPQGTGYDGELRHALAAVSEGSDKLDATLEDALALTRILEAERKSLESDSSVAI